MPDALLMLLVGLPAAVLLRLFMKWASGLEKRAEARETMRRVYYLRQRLQDDVPEWKRTEE